VRAKPGEVAARFDSRRTGIEVELCRKLARFVSDHAGRLQTMDPTLPPSAFNRVADNWRPLFAIAQVAGGDWPERAAKSFELLTARDDIDAHGQGVQLLTDIKVVLDQEKADRLFSKVLVEKLVAMTDRPWCEANGRSQKPITENWLAKKLRHFDMAPRNIRIEDTQAKGYQRQDFEEVFARYLTATPLPIRPSVPNADTIDENSISQASQTQRAGRIENGEKVNAGAGWDGGTVANTPTPAETAKPKRTTRGGLELLEARL
jgi:putative DNA primase/helicase